MPAYRIITCGSPPTTDLTVATLKVQCKQSGSSAIDGGVVGVDAYVLSPAEYQGMQQAVEYVAACKAGNSSICASVGGGTDNSWQELANMSIDDAMVLGTAVAGVWAVAWAFKAIIKAVSIGESSEGE